MAVHLNSAADTSAGNLVVLARTDRDAFGRLYEICYPKVFRYSLHRLFIRDVAEDVTSDVFLWVAGNMRRFSGETQKDFERWLYRVATNEVNAYVRRTRRRRELLEAAVRSRAIRTLHFPGTAGGGEDALDWPTLYQEILRLKPREQSIITLRFFEQMTHKEIAEVLRERPTTVRVALSRTLQTLRKRLGVAGEGTSKTAEG
jgi:RNA polymerase sigma-70 factor (ECF subfamily)